MKKIIKNNRGFTLIETMIAMAFFSIAVLGAGALYVKASQNNTTGNIVSSANFLAKTSLEQLKNLPLDDTKLSAGSRTVSGLDEYGNAGGIFTRTIVISEIDDGNARRITVTVTWPQGKRASDKIELTSNTRGSGI